MQKSILFILFSLISVSLSAQSTTKERPIYKVVDQMPRFPGCEEMEDNDRQKESCAKELMLEFIYGNLVYPPSAKKDGVEGIVVIQFIVNDTGYIEGIKIMRDIGDGCGKAAKAVVESMNDLEKGWRAGHHKGKPVFVYYTLPIRFKIDKKPESRIEKNEEYSAAFPECEIYQTSFQRRDCSNEKIEKYIRENLEYPEQARKAGIEANVWVSFMVDELGEIYDIGLVDEDPGYELGEAAMVVIEDMAYEITFDPALTNDKPVSSQWKVKVEFNL